MQELFFFIKAMSYEICHAVFVHEWIYLPARIRVAEKSCFGRQNFSWVHFLPRSNLHFWNQYKKTEFSIPPFNHSKKKVFISVMHYAVQLILTISGPVSVSSCSDPLVLSFPFCIQCCLPSRSLPSESRASVKLPIHFGPDASVKQPTCFGPDASVK